MDMFIDLREMWVIVGDHFFNFCQGLGGWTNAVFFSLDVGRENVYFV